MTATPILDRLSRVKAIKPGQWKAGCPCCESRKGYPLYVTEASDRVLIHAFCGCSTEAVLGRLGLSINDLFEKPLEHRATPNVPRIPAADVLDALCHEATTLAILANDLMAGPLSEEALTRLHVCAQRIGHARDYVRSRVG